MHAPRIHVRWENIQNNTSNALWCHVWVSWVVCRNQLEGVSCHRYRLRFNKFERSDQIVIAFLCYQNLERYLIKTRALSGQKMPTNTNGNSQVVFKSTWIFEPFCPTPLIWIFDVFDVGVISASRSLRIRSHTQAHKCTIKWVETNNREHAKHERNTRQRAAWINLHGIQGNTRRTLFPPFLLYWVSRTLAFAALRHTTVCDLAYVSVRP